MTLRDSIYPLPDLDYCNCVAEDASLPARLATRARTAFAHLGKSDDTRGSSTLPSLDVMVVVVSSHSSSRSEEQSIV